MEEWVCESTDELGGCFGPELSVPAEGMLVDRRPAPCCLMPIYCFFCFPFWPCFYISMIVFRCNAKERAS